MTGDVVRPFVRQDTALERCEGHQVDEYSGKAICCECGAPGCPCDPYWDYVGTLPVHPGFVQVAAPVRQVDYSPPTALEWVTMAAIVLAVLAVAGVAINLAVEYLARPGVGFLLDFVESRGWTK
jgi:hypothetical protein